MPSTNHPGNCSNKQINFPPENPEILIEIAEKKKRVQDVTQTSRATILAISLWII
jgi:hypothetical protein